MGGAWVKRWSPGGEGHSRSLIGALKVHTLGDIDSLPWTLPPSKSHAIRMMALVAQSKQTVTLNGMMNAGEDAISMRRCLIQMGVKFDDLDQNGKLLDNMLNTDLLPHEDSISWRIHGVGPTGLVPPVSVLHAGNSGTALRILMALTSHLVKPIMLDGDASLRSRPHGSMINTMKQLGVSCSFGQLEEGLPLLVEGPWAETETISVDVASSSQPTTSWLLASPGANQTVEVRYEGEAVSQRHSSLTLQMCSKYGAPFGDGMPTHLGPWLPTFQNENINIPADMSLSSFAFLAAKVLKIPITIKEIPSKEDALGHELLLEKAETFGYRIEGNTIHSHGGGTKAVIDLRDCNDLITPIAAMMALGGGGRITGAVHAAYKESNRITRTHELLAQYGLTCTSHDDGLEIPGGQELSLPHSIVHTHHDHRLQMTALILALGCQGTVIIEGDTLHRVADPQAVKRWVNQGASIESFLFQPE
ncbi:MAG: hypothetical protein CMA10_03680 [Euryarchaeota archaeon]|nr:hypothetical protein [Euryarchaeota archaeon]